MHSDVEYDLATPKVMIPRDVVAAFFALVVVLVGVQYHTLAKLILLPAGSTSWDLGTLVETIQHNVRFDFTDGLLCVLLLLPTLYVLIAEVRHRRFTHLLNWVFADDRRTVAVLGLTSLVSVRYYFAVGALSWAGDAPQHLSYLAITTEIFENLELPIWTNYYGAGSPFLQFYGFLYFIIGAAVNLVVRDLDLAAKLVLGLSHAASGIGVYYFCRVRLDSRRAAFLAGIAYVLCFYHTQQILMMGRHPVGLVYALLPLPFVFTELSLKARSWHRHAVVGGMCHAALVFTHPGYGLYATGFLVLYVGLRSFEKDDHTVLFQGLAVTFAGLVLSAPHTIPMLAERSSTGLSLGWTLGGVDGPTLHHLLSWSNYRFWLFPLPAASRHWYGGYFGLSLFAIAIAGIAVSIRSRAQRGRIQYSSISVTTAFAFVLPFACSSPWLKDVPLIPNFSGARYLLFAVFFLSVSVGVGAKLLSKTALTRESSRLFTVLVVLVLLDLGPTTFQQPFGRGLESAASTPHLSDGELKNFRNFLTLKDRSSYSAMSQSQMIMRTPVARAPHPGDLLVQSNFVVPLEESLTGALQNTSTNVDWDRLNLFRTGLRMLNVRYLVREDPYIDRMDWYAPVLVSGSVVSVPEGERLLMEAIPSPEQRAAIVAIRENPVDADWVSRYLTLAWTLRHSTVDTESGSCANIVVASGAREDLGTNPECTVVDHEVRNTRVHIRVSVTDRCYARLAYGYFPHLNVTVNGEPVEPLVTAGSFMAIPLAAGEHTIELVASLSPLRKTLWLLDLLLLVGWFAWGRSRFAGDVDSV
jgi:hypothetical protein